MRLRRKMSRLQSAAADFVDGHPGNAVGQSRADQRLSCRILAGSRSQDLAHDDLGKLPGLDTAACDERKAPVITTSFMA
jgi:hypothetical protein